MSENILKTCHREYNRYSGDIARDVGAFVMSTSAIDFVLGGCCAYKKNQIKINWMVCVFVAARVCAP